MDNKKNLMKILSGFLFLFTAFVQANESIIYQHHQARKDPLINYTLEVLQLAVAESGVSYSMRPSKFPMPQSRAIFEIKGNTGTVDILATMTTPEREQELLPIRIPIDRGLIGWRLLLVRESQKAEFNKINSIEDMVGLHAGQMHDWPDTTILKSAGLTVDVNSDYEGLFKSLAFGRIDYFPRSIIEIESELNSHPEYGLTIEPTILIRYPAAFYFFVSRQRPQLAVDIERGLRKAIDNGKFNNLFHRYFDKLIITYNLANRTNIIIENPLLPAETPINNQKLWFNFKEKNTYDN